MSHRNICITAIDGNTGSSIAKYILEHENFKKKVGTITGLALNQNAPLAKEVQKLGVKIVQHKPGRVKQMVEQLKSTGADTICLIPPASEKKMDITRELVDATKKAGIPNVCFISSAGCDLADPQKQPRLREFIELETMVLAAKGDPDTQTGHSPVVIRPGFYAENLLLYAPQMQQEQSIPLPIGDKHKFAPMGITDLAHVAAHVLTGKGKHGFSDKHRGQLMVLTGPLLCAGEELATAASQALGTELEFEDISENEARSILEEQSSLDPSEIQYLLEYYSLVRDGKTNYISTTAYHDVTGQHPLEPPEFFNEMKKVFENGGENGNHEDGPPGKKRKVASK
ncbi:hypothetical protein A1O7_02507 [Cladophialophora yegresii CBS 114405]|uniref:NmrA-like domain-containing protein n=1 Tax=Cladophialophora yegresii CBS 114405 TaxID=1182544 RepID=W9WUT8_9EURO|nr:uncharacterized protein A1O7_02507 [Cladophialophora yegresii CBS 114405]EXJ62074.1 hypothetical protein A1O7_02507 [Cladophialophora yegresii CBS 114405]